MLRFAILSVTALIAMPAFGEAGLRCASEKLEPLPSEWRGLLADLRLLRSAAVAGPAPSTLRQQHLEAARALREKAKKQELTGDEAAELGALLLRLGRSDEALGLLRAAQARHPEHFALAANLGMAWHLQGDLRRAAEQLRLAVRLAPEEHKAAETLHLRLVARRLQEPPNEQPLDDLFGLAERRPLPANAIAQAQQLALWLPADGRLLWLLAELAARHGDTAGAAELLEAAVGEFGLASPAARKRRAELRDQLAQSLKAPPLGASDQKAAHAMHGASPIAFKSRRPLMQQRFDFKTLAAPRTDGPNPLPWGLLLETALDRRAKPTFPEPLKARAGLKVEMVGYMQPLGDDLETGLFLLVEQPVGCWYCELPQTTGIVCVELKGGKTTPLTRNPLKVTGTLTLNADDPEDFYFTVKDAEVGVVD